MKVVVNTESKVFKIILIIIMLIGAFVLYKRITENNKWIPVFQTKSRIYYLDKNEIIMKNANTIEYVAKQESTSGNDPLIVKFNVGLSQLPSYCYVEYNSKDKQFSNKKTYGIVHPDTIIEKVTNRALAIRGQKPVYGTTKHKWRSVLEVDGKPAYICLDAGMYDPKKRDGYVFLKYESDEGKVSKIFKAYVNVDNKVFVANKKVYHGTPGSIEEGIIYDAQTVFASLHSNLK